MNAWPLIVFLAIALVSVVIGWCITLSRAVALATKSEQLRLWLSSSLEIMRVHASLVSPDESAVIHALQQALPKLEPVNAEQFALALTAKRERFRLWLSGNLLIMRVHTSPLSPEAVAVINALEQAMPNLDSVDAEQLAHLLQVIRREREAGLIQSARNIANAGGQ